MKLAFLGDLALFCKLICIMCHFFRSVSDHGKCGIKLKLSTVGVHLSVVLIDSVVAMATGAKTQEFIKNRGIFVICVIHYML